MMMLLSGSLWRAIFALSSDIVCVMAIVVVDSACRVRCVNVYFYSVEMAAFLTT